MDVSFELSTIAVMQLSVSGCWEFWELWRFDSGTKQMLSPGVIARELYKTAHREAVLFLLSTAL